MKIKGLINILLGRERPEGGFVPKDAKLDCGCDQFQVAVNCPTHGHLALRLAPVPRHINMSELTHEKLEEMSQAMGVDRTLFSSWEIALIADRSAASQKYGESAVLTEKQLLAINNLYARRIVRGQRYRRKSK